MHIYPTDHYIDINYINTDPEVTTMEKELETMKDKLFQARSRARGRWLIDTCTDAKMPYGITADSEGKPTEKFFGKSVHINSDGENLFITGEKGLPMTLSKNEFLLTEEGAIIFNYFDLYRENSDIMVFIIRNWNRWMARPAE